MDELRFGRVVGDGMVEEWRYVHNLIVPPAAMSLEAARERAGRNWLENVYLGDVLVGCSTVRPPEGVGGAATVIARVLPGWRRRGIGGAVYERGLARAREMGAGGVETCVLAANGDGLRFALEHGFVEVERYVLDGESDLWVDLRLG
ncbi:N-acetyltransferase family protein [Streptomyces sp. CA-249302]|uniref:GNAT family N-acetyltransferase n=1 Tax=Streptomyces sp. CA-249302 TaxID=3240058 RepID=UPI003D8BD199